MPREKLSELGGRLERLFRTPDEALDLWLKLASPLMRALDWKPELHALAAMELVQALQDGRAMPAHLRMAVRELERNLGQLERACAVEGRLPTAYVGWLWRKYGVLTRAAELMDVPGAPDAASFAQLNAVRVLPPLTTQAQDGTPVRVGDADVLMEAALQEGDVLGRRRRLLEAAREVLLDTAVGLTVDPDQVAARQNFIARELTRINRLQAAGVEAEVALAFQLKEALRRRDLPRAHAVLLALDEAAQRRNDGVLARHTRHGLKRVWGGSLPSMDRLGSVDRSARESLGGPAADRVRDALEQARAHYAQVPDALSFAEKLRWEQHRSHIGVGAPDAILRAALSVDGCFELGGTVSPHRVVEETRIRRLVPFPAPELVLARTHSVEDLPSALVGDPRALLYDLAAGRLLSRRYVKDEWLQRERQLLRSEVRVYVLDGSGSMLGPRAYMRDAIMVAELATLVERLSDEHRNINTRLYYRYFNEELGPVYRVDNPGAAMEAISHVVTTPRFGGTDIETALLSCFEQIRAVREEDPQLYRAQIVLVTDGRAPVSLAKVQAAREAMGELPIGVSVLALGEENEALRDMAAIQRRRGQQVFYQFIGDMELRRIAKGGAFDRLPVHLPEALNASELIPELEKLADEISELSRVRDRDAMEQVEDYMDALGSLGVDPVKALGEGERARVEALRRDRDALQRRFDRWFPPLLAESEGQVSDRRQDADLDDLDTVQATLLAVADVTGLLGHSELGRQADAVEILERLLLDRGVAPWRYQSLLSRYPSALRDCVVAVRQRSRAGGP